VTAIMTKTLRNIVNGDTSRLTIVTDIRAADILLVRMFGRHSRIETSMKVELQLGEFISVGLKSQCTQMCLEYNSYRKTPKIFSLFFAFFSSEEAYRTVELHSS